MYCFYRARVFWRNLYSMTWFLHSRTKLLSYITVIIFDKSAIEKAIYIDDYITVNEISEKKPLFLTLFSLFISVEICCTLFLRICSLVSYSNSVRLGLMWKIILRWQLDINLPQSCNHRLMKCTFAPTNYSTSDFFWFINCLPATCSYPTPSTFLTHYEYPFHNSYDFFLLCSFEETTGYYHRIHAYIMWWMAISTVKAIVNTYGRIRTEIHGWNNLI